jgi:hypothetical protein
MDDLSDRRNEGQPDPSTTTLGAWPAPRQVDDWLGEISDDDWGEPPQGRPARRPDAVHGNVAEPVSDRRSGRADDRSPPARAVAAEGAVRRRRVVAVIALAAVLVIGAGVAVLVARGEAEAPATAVSEPATTTTPEQAETGTSTTPTTTAPSDTSTTPTTTSPSTPDASSFTLPEGTKLRRGEETDPELTAALQRALASAGYDPGPIDGTYGEQTEEAVIAFQEANDLDADGVVGPDTAAALNQALAAG